MKPLDQHEAESERRAVALRNSGHTYEEIAGMLGLGGRASAWKLVQRALRRIPCESVEEMRQLEGDRLDALTSVLWPRTMSGDLRATEVLLRVMERRARLFGLDMPVRVQQEVHLLGEGTDVDAEVQRLIRLMADRDAPPDAG